MYNRFPSRLDEVPVCGHRDLWPQPQLLRRWWLQAGHREWIRTEPTMEEETNLSLRYKRKFELRIEQHLPEFKEKTKTYTVFLLEFRNSCHCVANCWPNSYPHRLPLPPGEREGEREGGRERERGREVPVFTSLSITHISYNCQTFGTYLNAMRLCILYSEMGMFYWRFFHAVVFDIFRTFIVNLPYLCLNHEVSLISHLTHKTKHINTVFLAYPL